MGSDVRIRSVAPVGGAYAVAAFADRRRIGQLTWGQSRGLCPINELAVDPGYQRRGIGRALIEEAHRSCQRKFAMPLSSSGIVSKELQGLFRKLEAEGRAAWNGREWVMTMTMKRNAATAPDDDIFVADPSPWLEDTILDNNLEYEEDLGLFHVTTRISAVERDGVLKARRDLGAVRGLGGGPHNIAAGYVSFVFSLPRSRWLFDAMKAAREAVEISGVEAARAVISWTGFPDAFDVEGDYDFDNEDDVHELDEQMLELLHIFGIEDATSAELERLSSQRGWLEVLAERADEVNEALDSPKLRYEAIQRFEETLTEKYIDPEADSDEGVVCANIVGFTGHWHQFREIDPAELSIIQVAVRNEAPVDLEPRECELRFFPKDVLIIRTRVEQVGPVPVEGS